MNSEIHNPKITRFMILSSARSGTMMLTDALDTLPQTKFFNLYAVNVDQPEQYWKNWESFQQHCLPSVTHVGTTMHRVGEGWIKRFPHIKPENFWKEVRDRHEYAICLFRENLLRQFISRKVGVLLKTYKVDKPRAVQPPTFRVDPQEFLDFVKETWLLEETIDAQFPNRINISYEQLAFNWMPTMGDIFSFLGLPQVELKPITIRQETREIKEIVNNYPELSDCLASQGWSGWLN